jgi:hypothetical protein
VVWSHERSGAQSITDTLNHALGAIDDDRGHDAADLDPHEVLCRQGRVAEGLGEEVDGGDGIVHSQADPDSTDRGYGVGHGAKHQAVGA